jgi:hypothetical protein
MPLQVLNLRRSTDSLACSDRNSVSFSGFDVSLMVCSYYAITAAAGTAVRTREMFSAAPLVARIICSPFVRRIKNLLDRFGNFVRISHSGQVPA